MRILHMLEQLLERARLWVGLRVILQRRFNRIQSTDCDTPKEKTFRLAGHVFKRSQAKFQLPVTNQLVSKLAHFGLQITQYCTYSD